MRHVLFSVSTDVIEKSIKACGFSIDGYNPMIIPDKAYGTEQSLLSNEEES